MRLQVTSAISHGTWSSLFASISRHSGKRKKLPSRGRLHAHDAIVNTNLALPVELLYPILAEAFGDYLYRLLATPEDLDDINPFLACLHVNSTFRACTLKLMGYLWGNYDMLFDQHSGKLSNFKPAFYLLKKPSKLIRHYPWPRTPSIIDSSRIYKHYGHIPLVQMGQNVLLENAYQESWLKGPDSRDGRLSLFSHFSSHHSIEAYYRSSLAAGAPKALLKKVHFYSLTQMYLWKKTLALLCLIKSGSGPTSIGHNFEVFKSSMGSHPQENIDFQEHWNEHALHTGNVAHTYLRAGIAHELDVEEDELPMINPTALKAIGFFEVRNDMCGFAAMGGHAASLAMSAKMVLGIWLSDKEKRLYLDIPGLEDATIPQL